jgi:hypothetical protein
MHPAIPPRFLIAPMVGDIMICTSEDCPTRIAKSQPNRANPRGAIMRDSPSPKNRNSARLISTVLVTNRPAGTAVEWRFRAASVPFFRRGRTRTRRHPGSERQGQWKRPRARAPTVRARPAAPRSGFQRFDGRVALPWWPRSYFQALSFRAAKRKGNAWFSMMFRGFADAAGRYSAPSGGPCAVRHMRHSFTRKIAQLTPVNAVVRFPLPRVLKPSHR